VQKAAGLSLGAAARRPHEKMENMLKVQLDKGNFAPQKNPMAHRCDG
jgi:hypothetical protein